MRILGISASKRKWGNTDILVHHALKGASQEGAEIRFIRLTDLEIAQCQGCLSCLFKDRDCVLGDGFVQILEELRQADGVVLGSPIHILSAAGSLQNLVPRFFRQSYTGEFEGKPGIAIAVGGMPGWEGWAFYQVVLFFLSLGIPLVDQFIGYAQGPGEIFFDTQACERALSGGKAIARGDTTFRGESGICPSCHGNLVITRRDGRPWCILCGLPGQWEQKGGKREFHPLPHSRPRWGVKAVQAHFKESIFPSRDRLRARKAEIQQKLKALQETVRVEKN